MSDTHIWFDATELRSTPRAVLLEIEGEEIWVPRSQLGAVKRDGDEIARVELPRWIAEREGLLDPRDDL